MRRHIYQPGADARVGVCISIIDPETILLPRLFIERRGASHVWNRIGRVQFEPLRQTVEVAQRMRRHQQQLLGLQQCLRALCRGRGQVVTGAWLPGGSWRSRYQWRCWCVAPGRAGGEKSYYYEQKQGTGKLDTPCPAFPCPASVRNKFISHTRYDSSSLNR